MHLNIQDLSNYTIDLSIFPVALGYLLPVCKVFFILVAYFVIALSFALRLRIIYKLFYQPQIILKRLLLRHLWNSVFYVPTFFFFSPTSASSSSTNASSNACNAGENPEDSKWKKYLKILLVSTLALGVVVGSVFLFMKCGGFGGNDGSMGPVNPPTDSVKSVSLHYDIEPKSFAKFAKNAGLNYHTMQWNVNTKSLEKILPYLLAAKFLSTYQSTVDIVSDLSKVDVFYNREIGNFLHLLEKANASNMASTEKIHSKYVSELLSVANYNYADAHESRYARRELSEHLEGISLLSKYLDKSFFTLLQQYHEFLGQLTQPKYLDSESKLVGSNEIVIKSFVNFVNQCLSLVHVPNNDYKLIIKAQNSLIRVLAQDFGYGLEPANVRFDHIEGVRGLPISAVVPLVEVSHYNHVFDQGFRDIGRYRYIWFNSVWDSERNSLVYLIQSEPKKKYI